MTHVQMRERTERVLMELVELLSRYSSDIYQRDDWSPECHDRLANEITDTARDAVRRINNAVKQAEGESDDA